MEFSLAWAPQKTELRYTEYVLTFYCECNPKEVRELVGGEAGKVGE